MSDSEIVSVYQPVQLSCKHFVITTAFLRLPSSLDSLFIDSLSSIFTRSSSGMECFAAWGYNPRQHLHFYCYVVYVLVVE